MLRLTPRSGPFAVCSPTARRNGMREFLDGSGFTAQELAGNLREIRLINRSLGWSAATLRLVDRVVRDAALTSFSFLDVATGSGDLPLALLRRAHDRGWHVDVHALDASPAVLAEARRYLSGAPVRLHLGDARALPFADGSFDVVSCALSLHHFQPEEATAVVRELARVARHAWLVVDVERSFAAYAGARSLRIILRNRMTRHDAPATVLRAYTLLELRAVLAGAGLHDAAVSRQFPYRLVARGFGRGSAAPAISCQAGWAARSGDRSWP